MTNSSARLCLKRIDLVGFKSFADHTTLTFDEGVTAIVGPNGCGKSNIADAFRWVLGEQSAKSLRGEKMADVLFAGTAKRRAAPYCEVTLTFDNSDNHLPSPYQEVAISRRLSRKGESDYRINGSPCRLKDVHHLFFDTGLGKEAFAIFEQGKVEEIILRSPEERRPIFEQASGIARYRHRWKEAQRRLAQTEQHLTRAHDIADEVAKQIRLLEKQVAEANRYKVNKQRLEQLERGSLSAKWHTHQIWLIEGESELAILKRKISHSHAASEELGRAREEAKQALTRREAELKEATEALYTIRSSLQVQLAEGEGLKERLAETAERAGQCRRELETLKEQEGGVVREAETLSERRSKLKGQLADAQQVLEESQGSFTVCQKALHQCQEEQMRLQQTQMDQVQKAHALTSRLREGEVRLETAKERLESLKVRKEELERALTEQNTLVGERTTQSAHLTEEAGKQREQLEELRDALEKTEIRRKEIVGAMGALTTDLAQNRARQRVLLQLQEEGEGLPKGSRLLLQAAESRDCPFFDQLAPLSEAGVPIAGHEEAIATALQLYEGTLLAKSDAAFEAALAWAEEEQITGYAITSPDRLAAAASPKAPNVSSFVEPESPLLPLLQSLSMDDKGRLDQTGILFSPPAEGESPVLRNAELKKLASEINKGESTAAKLKQEDERLEAEKNDLLTTNTTLEQTLRQTEIKLVELNVSLGRSKADLKEAKSEQERVLAEQAELSELHRRLESETKTLKKEAEKAREGLGAYQQQADEVAERLEGYLQQVREFAGTRRDREQRLHELSLERHQVESTASLIEAKALGQKKEQARLTSELEGLVKKEKELSAALATVKEPEAESKELALSEEKLKKAEGSVIAHRQQLEVLEKEEADERAHTNELDKGAHQLEVQIAKERTAAEGLSQEMLDRFDTPISEENTPLDLPLEEAEKEIRSLRRAVEGATEVNLAAASEYDEKKTRHHFLSEQLGDLETSKQQLEEIITELDRESRERFEKTFEEVKRHFQEQFQILFDGGEADLTFVGSDDILQSGIDIVAKPPGKKMRSIKLLSGGEKCLTAMALLFALFKVKPAPFCILDEMDAPLDDSNIQRFINVVKPFMEQTQFLIITHNKRTMAAADILFGVSMEEKGVSRILSLEFEHRSTAAVYL